MQVDVISSKCLSFNYLNIGIDIYLPNSKIRLTLSFPSRSMDLDFEFIARKKFADRLKTEIPCSVTSSYFSVL